MRKPSVLVAIPFKGEIDYLIAAVDSIMGNQYVSGITYSIVLWDDGSTDDELNRLYNSIDRRVPIVKHANVGYTQAVYNIFDYAMKNTPADYILLANSDIKLRKGAFYAMINRMNMNANYATVGGKILIYDTDTIQHTGTVVNTESTGVDDPYCGLHKNDPMANNLERRLWCNGCCCLYNLNVLRKENLNFDVVNFPNAYFEESALQTELGLRGYGVLYEPRAEIDHKRNATMNHERSKHETYFWANWQRYQDMYFPLFKSNQLKF